MSLSVVLVNHKVEAAVSRLTDLEGRHEELLNRVKGLEDQIGKLTSQQEDNGDEVASANVRLARIVSNTDKLIKDMQAIHNLLVAVTTQVNLLNKAK